MQARATIRDLIRRDQDSQAEIAWVDSMIDEGLASPPSKRSPAEIVASHRKVLG